MPYRRFHLQTSNIAAVILTLLLLCFVLMYPEFVNKHLIQPVLALIFRIDVPAH